MQNKCLLVVAMLAIMTERIKKKKVYVFVQKTLSLLQKLISKYFASLKVKPLCYCSGVRIVKV